MDEPAPVDDAQHLRALLAERAQRAAELTTLHEITAQLTTLRDPQRLLQDIANRARELLRVDVAYLALSDGRGGLTMQVVVGTMGSRLRGFRMTSGVGIAGLVLTRGEPFWTPDYRSEPRIRHAAEADEISREENLGGILGVPLRSRDEVFGVLFAADRDVRPFSDAEVTLLSSLAAHAANAIENARLYESQRRATALHERLTGIVLEGGGVPEILAALADVLDVTVSFSENAPPDGGTVAAVAAGDDVWGYLCALGELGVTDRRQLERGAMVTALVLMRERALVDAELRARSEILEALVSGTGEADLLERRARAGGLAPGATHVVGVLSGGAEVAEVGERAVTHFGGLLAARAHLASVILKTDDVEAASEWFRRASTQGVTVGLARATGVGELAAAHDEARRCVSALLALGRAGAVASAADLGMYRFLLSTSGRAEAAEFVRRTIGALLEVDRKRGSDLAHTLEEYLASGRHHAATAEALFIHPNTLYQRLARIATVLGDDWKEPDRCLEVQTALRLHRIASVTASENNTVV